MFSKENSLGVLILPNDPKRRQGNESPFHERKGDPIRKN
tara:strand:- start:50 stop:166 length:117 start_codon:yes stop_codon:yes gene_type:complete